MKRKIKIQIAMAVTMLLFTARVYSQDMYINVGVGYGIPAAPNAFQATDNSSVSSSTGSNYSYQASYKTIKGTGSFGKGVQVAGTFGYMFNENIGAELGLSYLSGAKITEKYSDKNTFGNSTSSINDEATLSGKMIRFIPALKIRAGQGKTKPYIRAGLVIGVGAKLKRTENYTQIDNGISSISIMEMEYSGGTSIGFAGALGADFYIKDKISIFGEIGLITQSWAPQKGVITKYTEDGIDQLPDMDTYDKEVQFVDSYTESSTDDNTDVPSKQLKTFLPFSSVGITAGVHIDLGK